MRLSEYFKDHKILDKKIKFYLSKNQLVSIEKNKELVQSYLDKAKHNLKFFDLNKDNNEFNDWLVVTLYYSLYHCALALIANKKYMSKNHTATLLLLIKEYSIEQEEAELMEELSISKDDAELYTDLKRDRHNASYSTKILFTKEKIDEYRFKVVEFMEKTEEIINS
jgi:uncharacterized protein (UPF0332 family)